MRDAVVDEWSGRDRGAPIHLVAATLGHASIGTTGRYAHARPSAPSARYPAV